MQAAPTATFAIEPLYGGIPGTQPQAFGIYRRNRHGWYRITQRTSEEAAQVKMRQLQERFTNVQASGTTRPDEA